VYKVLISTTIHDQQNGFRASGVHTVVVEFSSLVEAERVVEVVREAQAPTAPATFRQQALLLNPPG
jgi:hypothetical protein